jgi:hypothetical protein
METKAVDEYRVRGRKQRQLMNSGDRGRKQRQFMNTGMRKETNAVDECRG